MKQILLTILALGTFAVVNAQDGLHNRGELYVEPGAALYVGGQFTNTTAGVDFRNHGTFTLTGNFTNDQVMSWYAGKIIFDGNNGQSINGTATFNTKDFDASNPIGVTLNTPLRVDGVCSFSEGLLNAATITTPIIFTSNASHTGASNASHVNGYVVKEGNGNFIFPIGDITHYEPASVNFTTNLSGTRAKYFPTDAGSAPYAITGYSPVELLFYNKLEQWDISPLSAATGTVTMYWNSTNNVGIGATSDLRVAHKIGG
ncbi:MAG: hypothetical protein EOO88_54550, partial [Pedobacter sp.]